MEGEIRMKKWSIAVSIWVLLLLITGCGRNGAVSSVPGLSVSDQKEPAVTREEAESDAESNSKTENSSKTESSSEQTMKISIESKEGRIIFQLNNSAAAKKFYEQLPMSIQIEDYNKSEKIFYLPEELDTSDTPLAEGPAGTLAYFEPWGNVAMFYDNCGQSNGLYELGEAISGTEFIETLTGELQITRMEETMPMLEITVGKQQFSAVLYDNAAARAFLERLPMTISMKELNGNEKYYYFSDSFPTASSVPSEIQAGELMLYGSDCLVLFYKNFSTNYSYTPLGYLKDPSGLASALGDGSAELSFAVKEEK